MSEKHAHYLRDLGHQVRQAALEAKTDVASAAEADREFQEGRRMAYYEVVSLMRAQALAFGIPLHDLALDGFDPDRDLL